MNNTFHSPEVTDQSEKPIPGMVVVEIGYRNVYAEYGLNFVVEKHHNIFLNLPLSNQSPVRDLKFYLQVIVAAVKIQRSDWLTDQAIRVFSFGVARTPVSGHHLTRYREMAALYLLMGRGLFDESDWSNWVHFD